MKLLVRTSGGGGVERAITIRNPNATLANLRAIAAIQLKIDAKSFRMTHTSVNLEEESVKLCDSGLSEGDVVVLVSKREREGDDESAAAPEPAVPSSIAEEKARSKPASPHHKDPNRQPTPVPDVSLPQSTIEAVVQPLVKIGFSSEQALNALTKSKFNVEEATKLLVKGLFDGSIRMPRNTSNHSSVSSPTNRRTVAATRDANSDEEDEEWEDMDSEEAAEDEQDAENAERVELALGLFGMENGEQLAQMFTTEPQAAMAQIQRENPRVFELIGRHHQFFLDLMQEGPTPEFLGRYGMTEDLVDLLDDLGEMDMDDEEMEFLDDEEGDFEEGDFEEGDEDDDDDHFAAGALNPQFAALMGNRGGRRGDSNGGGNNAYSGARISNVRPPAPAPQSQELTADDNANIEQLMGIGGFSREQAQRAYLAAGKNMDRAAAMLFDGVSQF